MNTIYAKPKQINDLEICNFYHTIDIPKFGTVHGYWDLREGVDEYIGHVNFKNKRVLEFGPANGFLTFFMEKKGAKVVACDLSSNHNWDIIPFAQYDHGKVIESRRSNIEKLNNAF